MVGALRDWEEDFVNELDDVESIMSAKSTKSNEKIVGGMEEKKIGNKSVGLWYASIFLDGKK